MSSTPNAPFTILIAALGGEGGGVLADWIVECALRQGLPVQATSVPGVAQRTGATSYYIELLRQPATGGAPVFALSPVPGNVDALVASELLEAARMVERGFVSARTTLVASTHRVYTTLEKMHMADGRHDPQRLAGAAQALAGRAVLFDMDLLTRQHGTVVSAVMFGALAGAGVLPWSREVCEAVIKDSGRGVQASLAGFAAAFDAAQRGNTPESTEAAPADEAATGGALDTEASAVLDQAALPEALRTDWSARLKAWPEAVQRLAAHGALRCLDYQNRDYAQTFLARVDALVKACPHEAEVARDEAIRHLALWMCYEDVTRVADLKSRASRFQRVRREAEARDGEIVRITEHFKPGPDEVAAVLPRALGEALLRLAERRGWLGKAHIGLHIRTSSLWGFLMLRTLAWLRPLRPRSLRFAQEDEALRAWLAALAQLAPRAPRLAASLAGLPQVIKGYGDTQVRGRQNYARLWAAHVRPALLGEVHDAACALGLEQALRATLADPEGTLNMAHARTPAAAQPVFWAPRRPASDASTVPPAA
jgi:indolepyruvate ferredoxin oxidoreductase beta subunit